MIFQVPHISWKAQFFTEKEVLRMKTRILIRVTLTAVLCLILTGVFTGSLPPFSALFQRIYAQDLP